MALRNSRYRSVAPALAELRRAFRHPVVLERAAVRRHAAPAHEAQLLDLSIYGCRIATDASVEANDRLWLRFEGSRPVAATAVWCSGSNIGCRFDAPMERELFRTLTLVAD
jgi:hypothetical protein